MHNTYLNVSVDILILTYFFCIQLYQLINKTHFPKAMYKTSIKFFVVSFFFFGNKRNKKKLTSYNCPIGQGPTKMGPSCRSG